MCLNVFLKVPILFCFDIKLSTFIQINKMNYIGTNYVRVTWNATKTKALNYTSSFHHKTTLNWISQHWLRHRGLDVHSILKTRGYFSGCMDWSLCNV